MPNKAPWTSSLLMEWGRGRVFVVRYYKQYKISLGKILQVSG